MEGDNLSVAHSWMVWGRFVWVMTVSDGANMKLSLPLAVCPCPAPPVKQTTGSRLFTSVHLGSFISCSLTPGTGSANTAFPSLPLSERLRLKTLEHSQIVTITTIVSQGGHFRSGKSSDVGPSTTDECWEHRRWHVTRATRDGGSAYNATLQVNACVPCTRQASIIEPDW